MPRALHTTSLMIALALGGPVALMAEGRPTAISPGATARFAGVDGACPTFHWAGVEGGHAYELTVYSVDADGTIAARPVLDARLPAGGTGWTPASERCLAPGRYAWSVRAQGGEWAEALLFEIAAVPTAAELERALAVVQAYLEAGGGLPAEDAGAETGPADPPGRPARPDRTPAAAGGAAVVAVQGEVADPSGETYGLRGLSHSPDGAGVAAENVDPGGADLRLAGSPPAELTELGLSREDPGAVSFDFTNPGAGSMTLSIDGVPVVTTATDQDTLGGLSCANGQVAKWSGSAWTCEDDLDTDTTYTAGNQLALTGTTFDVLEGAGSGLDADLLDGQDSSSFAAGNHTHGFPTSNTAVGDAALASITTGQDNTAVGAAALYSNTFGSFNTAVGDQALFENLGSSNTAVGSSALSSNTTGPNNTAVGEDALRSNTTGYDNTAVGQDALRANTGGFHNTAVGEDALVLNTEGSSNTAVGEDALRSNTTGAENTAVGRDALLSNTGGLGNTAVGESALRSATGTENTAVGRDALRSNTTGVHNTAVGASAMSLGSGGFSNSNTAVGWNTLHDNTGAENTAIGSSALDSNTSGFDNTAVGAAALSGNTVGDENTAVGGSALFFNTGSRNTAIGFLALDSNTTGDDNIAVGRHAGGNLTTGSDNIAIGSLGTAGESGRIRIGEPGTQIETFLAGVWGNAVPGTTLGVSVNVNGDLGTIASSARFKEEIKDLGQASERILELRPVSFRYKPDEDGQDAGRPLEFGLIAEEVAEVFPELVVYDEEGRPYSVRYHLLVPLLLNEVQRLEAAIGRRDRSLPAPEVGDAARTRAPPR